MKKLLIITLSLFSFFAEAQYFPGVIQRQKKNVLVYIFGDSITEGIGTTGTGSSASGPSPQGTMGYAWQLKALLEANIGYNFTFSIQGHSGEAIEDFNTYHKSAAIADITSNVDDYDLILIVEDYGSNDIARAMDIDLFSAEVVYNDKVALHTDLRAISPKVKTFVQTPIPRVYDTYYETRRQDLKTRLAVSSMWAGGFYSDLTGTHIDATIPPTDEDYAVDDVDGLSYVHPNDNGAAQKAERYAETILNYLSS